MIYPSHVECGMAFVVIVLLLGLLVASASGAPLQIYLFDVEVRRGNETLNYIMRFFEGEWVSDACSNYGLMLNLDNDAVSQIWSKVCGDLGNTPECDSPTPHNLTGIHNVSQLWIDNGLKHQIDNFRVSTLSFFVRKGQSIEQLSDLHCARFLCTPNMHRTLARLAQLDLFPLTSESLRSKFERVYEYAVWGDGAETAGGGSGAGSTLTGSENARKYLPQIIAQLSVESILDVGCGAMSWMPGVLVEVSQGGEGTTAAANIAHSETTDGDGHWHGDKTSPANSPNRTIRYTGVDIAQTAVDRASTMLKRYPHHGEWSIVRMDITSQVPPGVPPLEDMPPLSTSISATAAAIERMKAHGLYDLVIARDIFFHLPFQRIQCALNHFSRMALLRRHYVSNAKPVYLLATTEPMGSGGERLEGGPTDTDEHLPMGSYRWVFWQYFGSILAVMCLIDICNDSMDKQNIGIK